MTYIKKYFIFTIFFSSIIIYSQDTNIVKFFPLNVGNVWVYHGSYYSVQCQSSFKVKVRIDSVLSANGKTYYRFTSENRIISGGNCSYGFFLNNFYRIDSANGNVYRLTTNPGCTFSPDELIIDSLRSKFRDTIYICGTSSDPKKALSDTSLSTVFGSQKQSRLFTGGNFHEFSTQNKYAKDFGIIYYAMGGMSLSAQCTLTGCVINGVLYGDTSYHILGLINITTAIPGTFSLSQNFPNPFNPVTSIYFDIPNSSYTNLIVFDQIGREIQVLVNEQLSPGSYKFEWDAADFPSGIYFYKLQAGEFVETKKMVLIK